MGGLACDVLLSQRLLTWTVSLGAEWSMVRFDSFSSEAPSVTRYTTKAKELVDLLNCFTEFTEF